MPLGNRNSQDTLGASRIPILSGRQNCLGAEASQPVILAFSKGGRTIHDRELHWLRALDARALVALGDKPLLKFTRPSVR